MVSRKVVSITSGNFLYLATLKKTPVPYSWNIMYCHETKVMKINK